jgi:hypothetical protein
MSGTVLPRTRPLLDPTPTVATMQQLRALLGPAVQAHEAVALFDVGDSACYLLVSEGNQGHPRRWCLHAPGPAHADAAHLQARHARPPSWRLASWWWKTP